MNGGLLQWHVKNTRPTANFGMYSSSGQNGRICLGAEGHRGKEVQKCANSGVIVKIKGCARWRRPNAKVATSGAPSHGGACWCDSFQRALMVDWTVLGITLRTLTGTCTKTE